MAAAHQDLDETQLAQLRDDLGDAFSGFAEQFLDSARKLVPELEAGLSRDELADVAVKAHQLKGTAGYLGAAKLSDTLGKIQGAAESGDREGVRDLLQSLNSDLASLIPRLADSLGSS